MKDRNPKPDSPASEARRRRRPDEKESSLRGRSLRTLFLLCLTLSMVLAGALLLETIATSLGVETLEDSGAMAPGVNPGWGQLFLAYRYALSGFSLIFAYHCFVWREWARIGLCTVIVLDLVVWLAVSIHTFATTGSFVLDVPRMLVQVSVVCFEAGLLRLLLDDHIKWEFKQTHDRVSRLKNERTN